MASTTAYAGNDVTVKSSSASKKSDLRIHRAAIDWLEKNDYRGYDTFDGLNAYSSAL